MNKLVSGFVLAVAGGALALFAGGVDLTGAKCPVGGHQALAGMASHYKGGTVYFCCDGCPQAFEADPAQYATAANAQLFVTGQAKQVACPLTGKSIEGGPALEIAGKSVAFSGEAHKAAVSSASEEQRLELVFGEEAFARGFKVGD